MEPALSVRLHPRPPSGEYARLPAIACLPYTFSSWTTNEANISGSVTNRKRCDLRPLQNCTNAFPHSISWSRYPLYATATSEI
jgi:hypothetical protein